MENNFVGLFLEDSGLVYERKIRGGPTAGNCWQMFSWGTIGKADISDRWPIVTPQFASVAPTIVCYMGIDLKGFLKRIDLHVTGIFNLAFNFNKYTV